MINAYYPIVVHSEAIRKPVSDISVHRSGYTLSSTNSEGSSSIYRNRGKMTVTRLKHQKETDSSSHYDYNHRQKCWEGWQFLPFNFFSPLPRLQYCLQLDFFHAKLLVDIPTLERSSGSDSKDSHRIII